jgi:hypothetical protein
MGLVTDVFWDCPGCGSRERAQTYGEWDDPNEFHPHFIPGGRSLKWNPPCSKCGKFRLMPPQYVKHEPQPVEQKEGE